MISPKGEVLWDFLLGVFVGVAIILAAVMTKSYSVLHHKDMVDCTNFRCEWFTTKGGFIGVKQIGVIK